MEKKYSMEWVETALTVIGAISLVIGVIRFIWVFCLSGTEWIDNIEIKVEDWIEGRDYEEYFAFSGSSIYPIIYSDYADCGCEVTVNFIIPENTIIRNLKIKKLVDESIDSKKLKYKKTKIIPEITPNSPLCMIVERREAIAQYMVEWKTLYGGKASYYFYSNMRNGTYNKSGIKYTYSFWSRLRKYFGLI